MSQTHTAGKSVLDIGTGPGHFPLICKILGHHPLGLDMETEFYADCCKLFGIDRRTAQIRRQEPMPDFGRRFDLVTGIWITFDYIGYRQSGDRWYWNNSDWQFFFEDLNRCLIPTALSILN
jgi:cyclopropane fatty-acyl-phospholipid synthase-like methyltransferase